MKAVSFTRWSRRTLLLAGLAACSWQVKADDAVPHVRILFLGNSYTAFNRLPAMVGELMLSSQLLAPHIGSNLQGSYTLERHSTNAEGLALLKQGADDGKPWDVVVVQEQSVVSAAAAVDEDARLLMENGLSKLVRLAREVNPKVLVVDFQVWARHEKLWKEKSPDALSTGRDPEQAHARIHLANANAVKTVLEKNPGAQILVSPVGDFWWLVHDLYPALSLYAEDGTHPDVLGTLLSAYVIVGTIGGREVIEQATWMPPDCPAVQVARVKKMVLDHPEVFMASGK
ncbi:MAG: hypothetical protein B7Z37_00230 [Verrucomicrobia bacterium 12-59-8]|nr:MAG: hypothetical protein B7Z37_00230 [Verrucomicrobia bacterium 12-59-8]